jgi:hypothetical protein
MQVVPLAKRTRSHKFDRHELHWNGVLGLVWKKLKAIPPKFFVINVVVLDVPQVGKPTGMRGY